MIMQIPLHNVQVNRPDGKADPQLGKTVLDEPKTKQSDPTVLDLQLRAIAKQPNVKPVVSNAVYVLYIYDEIVLLSMSVVLL